jgi:hypothetical protein
MTQNVRQAVASRGRPTPLITFHPSSEDQRWNAFPVKGKLRRTQGRGSPPKRSDQRCRDVQKLFWQLWCATVGEGNRRHPRSGIRIRRITLSKPVIPRVFHKRQTSCFSFVRYLFGKERCRQGCALPSAASKVKAKLPLRRVIDCLK